MESCRSLATDELLSPRLASVVQGCAVEGVEEGQPITLLDVSEARRVLLAGMCTLSGIRTVAKETATAEWLQPIQKDAPHIDPTHTNPPHSETSSLRSSSLGSSSLSLLPTHYLLLPTTDYCQTSNSTTYSRPNSLLSTVYCLLLSTSYYSRADLEFDDDANGGIDRSEFRDNLWAVTRAGSVEQVDFAFRKLDVNRSGFVEREDLYHSMRRQLRLARLLLPMMVRQQVQEMGRSATSAARHSTIIDVVQASAEAIGLAEREIDHLDSQVEGAVDEVFALVALDANGAITQSEWRAAWERDQEVARVSGLEGLLTSLSAFETSETPHMVG